MTYTKKLHKRNSKNKTLKIQYGGAITFINKGHLNGQPNGEIQTITFKLDGKPLKGKSNAPKRYQIYKHAKSCEEMLQLWNNMPDEIKGKDSCAADFKHDVKKGLVKFDNHVHQEWYETTQLGRKKTVETINQPTLLQKGPSPLLTSVSKKQVVHEQPMPVPPLSPLPRIPSPTNTPIIEENIQQESITNKPSKKVAVEPSDSVVAEPSDSVVAEPSDSVVAEPSDSVVAEPSDLLTDELITKEPDKSALDIIPEEKDLSKEITSPLRIDDDLPKQDQESLFKELVSKTSLNDISSKINFNQKELLESIQDEYNIKDTDKSKSKNDVLKLIEKNNKEQLKHEPSNTYIYPHLDDDSFNNKINAKKEFQFKYDGKKVNSEEDLKTQADVLCKKQTYLKPHQEFVKNFLSTQTPYNGLLLFHGTGTGKTCASIGITENMRDYLKYSGKTQKIIVVASPNVQDNFKTQLFDERKLVKTNTGWKLTGCNGNKFLEDINISQLGNISKEQIIEKIKALIRKYYSFVGYVKFANYILKISKVSSLVKNKQKYINEKLNKAFSGALIVIDEVHNIRPSGSNKEGKIVSKALLSLVGNVKQLKLLLLSATPMYNDPSEIIYLLNILNLNDNRSILNIKDIFDKSGNLKISETGEEIGKKTLQNKTTGYISYVRGENPYIFPYRIFPKLFNIDNTFYNEKNKKPIKQFNGLPIAQNLQFIDVYLNTLGKYQHLVYDSIIDIIKNNYNDEDIHKYEEAASFGYTVLQAPINALNMVYPHPSIIPGNPIPPKFQLKELYGKNGLERIMKYKISKSPARKNMYEYKDPSLGKPFSPDEIGNYSMKLKNICNIITNSQGIILIYSQYIDAGLIPMALALEEMGFARYGDKSKSLLKNPPNFKIDVNTMQGRDVKDGHFKQAKYAMITGDPLLSPKNNDEVIALTNSDNINGEKIKVVLISSAGSEGLDFSNIRQVHVLDPWYNMNRIEQIIGRAIRNCSHKNLPFEDRNVQIYLHSTILNNQDIEAVDLYLYRYAENKAVKIGQVNRALKENAIDCLLNIEQSNFSADKMNLVVNQNLSTGMNIQYSVGDKPFTSICDYMDSCHFSCRGKRSPIVNIDSHTFTDEYISSRVSILISIIQLLMKEKYIYTKQELIEYIISLKSFMLEEIDYALTKMINDKNIYIHDKYNQPGNLVNVGELYLFHPVKLVDTHVSMNNRRLPFTEKIKDIAYNVSKSNYKKNKSSDDDNIIDWENVYKSIISNDDTDNLPDWYISFINAKKVLLDKMDESTLNTFLLHHILECLDFERTLVMLQYIYTNETLNDFYSKVKEYYDPLLIIKNEYTGILLVNKTVTKLYTFENNIWVESRDTAKRILASEMVKRKPSVDMFAPIIGFIGYCTNNKMELKLKKKLAIQQELKSGKKKQNTGFRVSDNTKSVVISYINIINDTINYDNPRDPNIPKTPELVVILEMLLRNKQLNDNDGKIWFQIPVLGVL